MSPNARADSGELGRDKTASDKTKSPDCARRPALTHDSENTNLARHRDLAKTCDLAALEDEGLLSHLAAGHADSLNVLMARHKSWMLRTADHILKDKGEAEDIVQEVVLELCQSAGRFDRTKGKVVTWILGITRNHALNRRRYLQSRRFYGNLQLDDARQLEETGEIGSRLRLARQEQSHLVQEMLSNLKPVQRETIELRHFRGLSTAKVAEQMGTSVEVVENNLSRGLRKLRELARKAGP
jgi:RNA polymerase sigma-70 factor (ECF subfamily)